MNLFFKPILFLGTAILLFSAHLPAIAGQTLKNQSKTSEKLETITVTAQKQEENIQDVPMGITAFTAQGIEDAKIESVSDLADFIPSLMIFGEGATGANTPSMRGVHAPFETLTLSTGLFMDGVPVQSVLGFEATFLDIERVEVLRGPQGTLYGKNTEAGVINIITRQPDNNFRGSVSANIGTLLSSETDDPLTQTYTINLSGPIKTDKLFIGIAGKFHQKDGFIENTATNEPADDREHWFGRAHLRWTPTDQLDISFITSQIEYDGGGVNMNLGGYGASVFGLSAPDYRKVSSNFKGENNSSGQSQSLKINYEINDAFRLTSVTSRRFYNDKLTNDWDFSSATLKHTDKDSEYTTLSQELRLNYNNGGVKWIAGVYGDKDEAEYNAENFSDYPSMANVRDRDVDGNTYAVFTNLTCLLSQRFSLVGGLRYETIQKEFQNNINAKNIDDSWEALTPKFALEYRPLPGIMTYISASKGYRAGGFNFLSTDPEYESFDEEELWSYEIGAKNTFFNNRLVVNASIYLMDLSDMQVSETVAPTESYITNAAEATGKGVELELMGKITAGLTIMAGFGYTDIEFDDFKDTAGDYQGNTSTYSPGYTFNIGAQYRWENGFYARADLIGYGEMYFDKANEYKRDAYQIVNAKIGYETEHFDVYLYGKNIFDEEYDSYGYYGGYYTIYSDPGEVGLQVTYRF
ncbi:TonB-dependent receptor domain-containing protein [Desulfobacter postgatei]|uniref:TonB-dependent receptor n=1 Tax=Desulfobacter postgatei TaxID=2293 RepID=UPI002A370D1D|nr:TonB-dependent receptor [Desulfobacter postgatei]MDX9963965.1 TonB-dependent receptor [Desulfobacter postgatei]